MKPNAHQKILEAYELYADAIFRHCYFRLFDREQALDIMQDAFVKTWKYLEKGEKVENLRAFLYKVANNLIIDSSRKKKAASLDAMIDQGFDIPNDSNDRMIANLEGKRIAEVMRQLDEAYRDVVTMRYIDDLLPSEISEITGESENVISVRLHRGVEKLRKLLNN